MSNPNCATPGCSSNQIDGYLSDHFGIPKLFCAQHCPELAGVRQRIQALCDQISGLQMVSACVPFNPTSDLHGALNKTLAEQGALLVQLIERERELTGAVNTIKTHVELEGASQP